MSGAATSIDDSHTGKGWESAAMCKGPDSRDPAQRSALSGRKRAFDIVLAAAAILLFLPLLVTIALAIRLDGPGPAVFRQRRTGLNGNIFTIYKFRTMRVESEDGSTRQATRDDDRVTRIGSLLRKLSLDELPQLLNVLQGDMSIVGPRPHAIAHDDYFAARVPAYAARFRARPGLTGFAQVNGLRGEVQELRCMADRIAADQAYIQEWSFALDIMIILRTVPLLLIDPKAY